jgi:4-amino-4-deoxy-L-arabinose transferase-like glycosyltransferase
MSMRSMLAQAVLAWALTMSLYALGLAVSPPHLTHDEIKFALQAKSIADTGRDINGRFLPLYFVEPGFSVGRDPICIYVMAAVLRVLPLSEISIRLSTVLVGAIGVGLTFVLAALLFQRSSIAWAAAALVALTPTYYIHSRLALSVIYPVPFTLAWLIALVLYLSRGQVRYAVACGVILGLGVYSYLAAAIMMPLYLVATVVTLLVRGDRRGVAAVVVSFAAMLLPLAYWRSMEPDRYGNILSAYRLYDPQQLTPAQKLLELVSVSSLKARLDTWWDAFNPSRLFFSGESSLQISTRQVGSFLLPVAVFMAAGVGELLRTPVRALGILLLFGFITAPLPGVVMLDVEIRRWLFVVPFAVTIAAFGIARLLRGPAWLRIVCVALLLLVPLQFATFARDYFGPYRERSTTWFGGDIRGALAPVLDDARAEPPATVYVSTEIPWVDAYWRFYATARGQQSLLERTRYVQLAAGDIPPASPSDVLVVPAASAASDRFTAAGWTVRHVIREPNGTSSFVVARGRR